MTTTFNGRWTVPLSDQTGLSESGALMDAGRRASLVPGLVSEVVLEAGIKTPAAPLIHCTQNS